MAKKSEFIDVKGAIDNYIKHWWWFAISVVLCLAIGYAFVKIVNPQYLVRANIVVVDDDTSSLTSMSGLSDLFGSSADVEDEVFVVGSHSVLRDVSRDLGINKLHYVREGFMHYTLSYPDYPVDVYAAPGIADTLMTTIVFKTKVYADGTADVTAKAQRNKIADVERQKLPITLNTEYGRFVINKTKYCPKNEEVKSRIVFNGYEVAAEDLEEDLDVEMGSKKSNVIELYLKTQNTDYGKAVLDEVVKKYNERGIAQTNLQGEKTAAFLDERLALISGDLASAESNIQNYKQSQGIVDVSTEASYNMHIKSSAEQKLITAQTRSEILKMTRDFLAQPQNAYELIPGSGDIPAAGDAIATYNTMILSRMEMKQNAKGQNKNLKQLDEQLDAMREAIISTIDQSYKSSLVTIRDAQAEVAKAQGKLGNIPSQEREFLGLKRQQEVKQQLYLFLLQRREETAMMIANAIPKGRIIDDAYSLSEPLGLGKFAIMLIALVIGLFIPVVALYIKKLLRSKFETRKELEQLTELPILGEICTDNSGKNLVVNEHDTSSTTELFRLVRSSLQFMLNDVDDKVVLVTSTRSGEGKSFISLNTAASLALLGKKVLLIGMDIRNPRLGDYLHISNKMGLTVYLSQQNVSLDDIITPYSEVKGLDIIVGGPVPPNPGELLTSQKVNDMFDELRKRYDYIIVDSAPVGMVSDTFNLVRISDATVYVCRVNYTSISDINFVNTISEEKRMRKLSLVVNGTKTSKGYGYGYGRSNTKH
jgi:capsular exopolysaccharide synthesis family protein